MSICKRFSKSNTNVKFKSLFCRFIQKFNLSVFSALELCQNIENLIGNFCSNTSNIVWHFNVYIFTMFIHSFVSKFSISASLAIFLTRVILCYRHKHAVNVLLVRVSLTFKVDISRHYNIVFFVLVLLLNVVHIRLVFRLVSTGCFAPCFANKREKPWSSHAKFDRKESTLFDAQKICWNF